MKSAIIKQQINNLEYHLSEALGKKRDIVEQVKDLRSHIKELNDVLERQGEQ